MALPTTKTEFIEYCLRRLGKPVIQINVSTEQVSDAYDEAILFYNENHMDGSVRQYYAIQVTQEMIDAMVIPMPSSALSVREVLTFPSAYSSQEILFDVNYQVASQTLWNTMFRGTTPGLFDYQLMKQSVAELAFVLVTTNEYGFNRHTHELRLFCAPTKLYVGQWVVCEISNMIDPEEHHGIYKDTWLINYCTAKIKLVWGSNMQKFSGVNLPGGVSLNGDAIYSQAQADIQRLEEECESKWNAPLGMLVG